MKSRNHAIGRMLKRDLRLFLRCLIPAIMLTAVFAAVSVVAVFAVSQSAQQLYRPVQVAVVDREDTVFSRMLVKLAGGTDYISPLIRIVPCEPQEAQTMLEDGQCAAVIVLPEAFVEDITTGAQAQGEILLSASAASWSQVVESAAQFGQVLLAAGQYAIFSGEKLVAEHGLGQQIHTEFLETANPALLTEAMQANSLYFTAELTAYEDTQMTVWAYYGLCWTVMLLLLSAMFFTGLYKTDIHGSMLCRLRAAGIGDGAFLLGKLLLPWIFRLLLLLPVVLAAGAQLRQLWWCLPAALLASLVGAASAMGLRHGQPMQIFLALGGLFLCGGMLPRQLLPEVVLAVGAWTPFGAVQALLSPAFGGTVSVDGVIAAVCWSAVSITRLLHCLRQRRIGGESG